MQIEVIETPSLGNRGYLIHDGDKAVAIDVQRDYDRWRAAAEMAGVTITHVLETHMHNDYVTGGYRLAQAEDAVYVVPADSGITFTALELEDGQEIETASLRITGWHTPGHTEHHMSYQVDDDNQTAVFTGGGILYGTVGRTDLVSPDKTQQLTAAQYDSAHRLGGALHDAAAVFPTHGFGSFCSSSDGSGVTRSTMQEEKQTNIAFTAEREDFIRQIMEGLGPYPRYYAHMGPLNQQGPGEVAPLSIRQFSPDGVAAHLKDDHTWVVDTRQRQLFAASHPKGALGVEMSDSFSTYVGWLVPWGDTIVLVGDAEATVREAYLELTRIGMEGAVSGATTDMTAYSQSAPQSTYEIESFAALAQSRPLPYVLDVRLPSDWDMSHISGARNIPLHELVDRVREVPDDQPVWVHCASGYRASIAAAILDQHGRRPVVINDSYEEAEKLGLLHK